MPPDIEWQVTDRDAPETIVKTESGPPPRWRKCIIIVVILIISAGLLATYAARPATTAPVVTPMPTDAPRPPLKTVKNHETRARTDGGRPTSLDWPDPALSAS